ncbi:MAG: copper resistance protein NlpE [Flavobacteriaceae bacterium]|jgi:uncharacterized lipoprotein NlpE involved in copper resistance|nr:copper resistance protein NlpE [Flavobacteriaceae bacterium]
MIKKIFLVAFITVLTIGCDKKQAQNIEKSQGVVTDSTAGTHNAQNSSDITGTYKGIMPCADCAGIETQITLENNNNYTLTTRYLGKGEEKPFESKGKYTWNDTKDRIILDADKIEYKVEEGKLIHLDEDGNIITGELAPYYVLVKEN